MRLIKASSLDQPTGLQMVDFTPDKVPRYAILSHTWGENEVVYTDIVNRTYENKATFKKIRYSCIQTLADELQWVWIDSCCIDKASSAELSEAINSMFEWYQKSEICYTYLSDVPATVDVNQLDGEFAGCRWFKRGWTLQELLAPADLIFFSEDWVKIGEKATASRPLSVITGIDEEILIGARPPESASVAKRMSWAAHRKTTRPEDAAYCLMGLFSVNMPMLYGEGDKAFLRLQEEIMKQSDDQSLFAWVDLKASADTHRGLLARSPLEFAYSNSILPYQDWEHRPPYNMTNRGLSIDLPMTRREEDKEPIYVAALDCPAPPDYEDSSFLAIYLKKVSHGDQQYARVRVGQFAKVHERGIRQAIYVRQNFGGQVDAEGVFPHHTLQLRRGPDVGEYKVQAVVISEDEEKNPADIIMSSRGTARHWIPAPHHMAFRDLKGMGQLSGAVVFERPSDKERLLVMLGSVEGLKVGFHAMDLPVQYPNGPEAGSLKFDELQKQFQPVPAGRDVETKYHRVGITVDVVVVNATKFLMIDMHVNAIASSSRVEEAMGAALHLYDVATGRQNRAEAAEAHQANQKIKKSSTWRRLMPTSSK